MIYAQQNNMPEDLLLSAIFSDNAPQAPKGKQSLKVTEFIVMETFAGKKELNDILTDLLYSEFEKTKH